MLSANYRLPLPVGSFIAITFAHSDDDSHTYEGIDAGADKRQMSIKKGTDMTRICRDKLSEF